MHFAHMCVCVCVKYKTQLNFSLIYTFGLVNKSKALTQIHY